MSFRAHLVTCYLGYPEGVVTIVGPTRLGVALSDPVKLVTLKNAVRRIDTTMILRINHSHGEKRLVTCSFDCIITVPSAEELNPRVSVLDTSDAIWAVLEVTLLVDTVPGTPLAANDA